MFAAATARSILKDQLLQLLQSNQIKITDDLQMTDVENRILEYDKLNRPEEQEVDQCRVCLEYGIGLLNLFKDCDESPSTVEKLLECSRISQVCSVMKLYC